MQMGWQRELVRKGIEVDKYLQTVPGVGGGRLRQIINVTVIVMYHDWGKVDIYISEGKYKDLVHY